MSASVQDLRAWREADPENRELQNRPNWGANRPRGDDLRTRKHLTEDEIDAMCRAARKHRYGLRDELLILLGYRHGLRAAELIDLRWDQYDRKQRTLYVRRIKGSLDSTHTMEADELRKLNQLRDQVQGPFVFLSSRDAPLSYSAARYIIQTSAKEAGIPFPVNVHALRHSCATALANQAVDVRTIQNWMGHTNIQHTLEYARKAAVQFEGIWRR